MHTAQLNRITSLRGIDCRVTGKGLWKDIRTTVRVMRVEFLESYKDEDTQSFCGVLRLTVARKAWDVRRDKNLHGDELFLEDFRAALEKWGFPKSIANRITYTEAPSQEENKVLLEYDFG